jgi:hypothetical protein
MAQVLRARNFFVLRPPGILRGAIWDLAIGMVPDGKGERLCSAAEGGFQDAFCKTLAVKINRQHSNERTSI